MRRRPLVFICMPITPRNPKLNPAIEYLQNCQVGIKVAIDLIKAGFSVYCPGLDMLYWMVDPTKLTAEDIYSHDLSMLEAADAVFVVGDYWRSPNCQREVERAKALGKLIAFSIDELIRGTTHETDDTD